MRDKSEIVRVFQDFSQKFSERAIFENKSQSKLNLAQVYSFFALTNMQV